MDSTARVMVKDNMTGMKRPFPERTFHRHMASARYAGKPRYEIVRDEMPITEPVKQEVVTRGSRTPAPVEKKSPVRSVAGSSAHASTEDEFLKKHRERVAEREKQRNQVKQEE